MSGTRPTTQVVRDGARAMSPTKCHLNRGDSTVPELPHWPLKSSHGLRSATTRTASAFATCCWRARHRPCPGPPMRATSKPSGTGSAGALAGEGQAGPPAGPGPAGCGGGGRSLPGGGLRGSGPTVPRRLGAGMHAHRPTTGVRVATVRPRAEPPRAGFASGRCVAFPIWCSTSKAETTWTYGVCSTAGGTSRRGCKSLR